MWIGIFLACLGALYLLRNMGIIYGDVWDWAWPILLICLGLGMVLKSSLKNPAREKHG